MEEVKISMDRNNRGHSYKITIVIVGFMLRIVVLMQLVLRPLFLAFNWSCLDEKYRNAGHLLDIARYGFAQDCAMAGYFAAPLLLLMILPDKCRRLKQRSILVYLSVLSVVISLVAVGDALLYQAWQSRIDASVYAYLAHPSGIAESVSTGQIACFVGLLFVLASFLEYRFMRFYGKMVVYKRWKWRDLLEFVPLAALIFVAIRGIALAPNHPVNAYYSKDKFSNHAAVNGLFNLLNSTVKGSEEANVAYFDEKKCDRIYKQLSPALSDDNILQLRTTRPNVLVIIMEGFGAHMIKGLGGKPDIAPRLTELCDSSICFTNAYCTYWRTVQGIVSVLSGYPAQPTTYILHDMKQARTLGGIAKTLSTVGYDTHVLYGGDITYFNFLDYFYACGHKSYTSLTDFPDVKQSWRSGVPDGRTFDWLYDNIMHRKAGQKWMMSFLTLSSHDPFTVPYKRLKDKRDNAFAYTDSCVGAFVDKLKKTPQWKNTLIVLTSDHSFIYTPQIDVTDTVYAHIPIMFLGGAIEKPQRVNRIVSQVDIAATLLSLMHLPHIQFPFSKNVLSKDYTYPYAWNCYNNGFMFRDSTGCTVYDMNQNKVTYGYDKVRLEKAKAYVQKIYEDLNRR